jgi:hypothetical protein
MPGTIAMSPASKPCLFKVKLQADPTEPTSSTEGPTPISRQTPSTAFRRISGTVIPISFPNFDW